MLNIAILGPQGSGKGTQAKLLATRRNLFHLEAGALLRAEAVRPTALGRSIASRIRGGKLVPPETLQLLLRRALTRVSPQQGMVFDGTPRRMVEVRFWERVLPRLHRSLTVVLLVDISRRETIKRLSTRRTCRQCGTPYILGVNLKPGLRRCPQCGGEIYQRDDDKPQAISRRLAWYRQQTGPVIAYYKKRKLLKVIDGEQSIQAVHKDILKAIRDKGKGSGVREEKGKIISFPYPLPPIP